MGEIEKNEVKIILQQKKLNIKDKYVELILGLVNYLRENDYSIDIPAVINYFELLQDIDIFEFQEMIDVMKTLFAKNKYQYLNLESYVCHYFYEIRGTGIYDELGNKFKEHIAKKKEEQIKNLKEPQIEDVDIRITKKEQDIINEKDRKQSECLNSILEDKNLNHLKPILNLDIDKMKEYLTKENLDTKKIELEIREVMMENISKNNNSQVNEICILAGKKTKSLAKKMKYELTKKEREQARIEKEFKLIEKKFSKEHRLEFLEGKNAVKLTEKILDKNIEKFNEEELEFIGEYIKMNATKFKMVASRTMKKDKRKKIDFKKTMKESVSTFGYPVELYYKKPTKKKTKIMCIMDISGSVKKHSKLLSYFIYEMSSVFTGGVKSYAFIRELEDVTSYMTDYELSEGYEMAMASVPRGYSDYNTAFKMFSENHLKKIDRNTIVIILGDARNNKNKSGIKYLKEINDRAKSVIWLNPDSKKKWNQGDSIIETYEPYIDSLYIASTPNQLIDFLNDFKL